MGKVELRTAPNKGMVPTSSALRNGIFAVLTFAALLPAQGRPRVLIDLSHEFTFRYAIFGADL